MMSSTGHAFRDQVVLARKPDGPMAVGSFPMPADQVFERHRHRWHQLAWAAEGVVVVETPEGSYVLPPTQALWIPAGVFHTTASHGATTMLSPYVRPQSFPFDWTDPTVIAVSPLLRELIVYLADPGLREEGPRERAEAVLFDLLEPVERSAVPVPMPLDDRAALVARAILADPADGRSLDAWGRTAKASGRTLARAFAAETGLSFGEWRTQVRLRAALCDLAAGAPVAVVARRVGYATPSAFTAAFRRAFGAPPTAYLQRSAS